MEVKLARQIRRRAEQWGERERKGGINHKESGEEEESWWEKNNDKRWKDGRQLRRYNRNGRY